MENVNARVQGNSVVFTVPKAFNVITGTEYTVIRQSDSSLDNFDYAAELQREYLDFGCNPREVRPFGREKLND